MIKTADLLKDGKVWKGSFKLLHLKLLVRKTFDG